MSTAVPLALVTGAAGGIGSAVTHRLVADGYSVLASDRAGSQLPATTDSISTIECDVASEDDVAAMLAAAESHRDPLTAVVHVAGIVGAGPLTAESLEEWRHVIDVNVTSAFMIMKAAHDQLARAKGAAVLFASTNAINGGSLSSGPAYSVAKAGIVNLVRYLAKEWAPEEITVNCVAPGPVDTPMLDRLGPEGREALAATIPLGRLATADDVAAAVAYLCSSDTRYMTGTVQNVSGGLVLD